MPRNGRKPPTPDTAARLLREAHESEGEYLFAKYLRLLAPDVPEPETEYHFDAVRNWRLDFCWPGARVAVEVDGGNRMARIVPTQNGGARAVAIGRHTKDEDLDKCNTATAQGWRIFHITPGMLARDPERCIAQVRALVGCEIVAVPFAAAPLTAERIQYAETTERIYR